MNAATEIRLFDDLDRGWIASLLALVTAHVGKPWRVLLDRIERSDLEVHPSRVATVVRAIRRSSGGTAERARVARAVRGLVLGRPALDADERDARLAAAAAKLGIPANELEPLLWADLALERPVALADGPPSIDTLLAQSNLDRIQRAVRRARSVTIRVRGPANELVRTIARYGLIARVRRGRSEASRSDASRGEASRASRVDGDAHETILEVAGPLALFHHTTVYGKALAQLVPLLAEQSDFTLEVSSEFDGVERTLTVAPPLRLPAVRPSRAAPNAAERLARDLERSGHVVDRTPTPIAVEDDLLFAELAVEVAGHRRLVEVLGFSTAEHLTYKLERYALAGIEDIVLCVDVDRSAELVDDRHVLPFRRRVDSKELVVLMNEAVSS